MEWQPIVRSPVVPLSHCLNLAPAGTGTQTLHDVLVRLQQHKKTRVHHNHNQPAALTEPEDAWFLVNKTRCLIMTVRDPAERLASGMRFDIAACNSHGWLAKHGGASCMHAMHVKNASAWVPERALSLSTWISTLRNSFDPWHNASVQLWAERTRINLFFIPQAAYMHSVQACNVTTEIHFLCSEALTTGLRLLLGNHSAADVTRHTRSSTMLNHSRSAAWAMSDADRLFVRRCMFPSDTLLHHDLCSNGNSNSVVSFVVPPASGRCVPPQTRAR